MNLSAPPIRPPEIGSRWRYKNGAEYEVIQVANLSAEKEGYPVTIVYRGPSGAVWAKPLTRWYSSMFLIGM
jgi:hypothetical protein